MTETNSALVTRVGLSAGELRTHMPVQGPRIDEQQPPLPPQPSVKSGSDRQTPLPFKGALKPWITLLACEASYLSNKHNEVYQPERVEMKQYNTVIYLRNVIMA